MPSQVPHSHILHQLTATLLVYQKLLRDQVLYKFKPDEEEEFEDANGNILNKKTYQDLEREGMLDL